MSAPSDDPHPDGFGLPDAPVATLEDWRAKVGDPAASGVPVTPIEDGIDVPWLFVARDVPAGDPAGAPDLAPFTRGTTRGDGGTGAWDIRQEQRLPVREAARAAIVSDLEGGATSIAVQLDASACDGLPPDDADFAGGVGRGGVAAYTLDDLDELLDGVMLELAPVALHAGASGAAAAAVLIALWRRRGHDLKTIGGALGIDPLGALAATGVLHSEPADELVRAGRLVAEADALLGPAVTVLGVDTVAYAAAGASAAQELAVAVATAVAYLRAGEAAGLAPARTAARLEFTLQGDADQFLGIAKLRAGRRVWARVLEACDVPAAERRSRVVSRTSDRMLAAVDPWVNLLRATSAAFAAAVGGADSITVSPFDLPRGTASELGRRIARNTQHVLADEAHLNRVVDPGGGAWYVEWLTDRLARAAWDELQAIERAGGMLAALQGGHLAARIAESAAGRADDLRHRRRVLTGVNAFALLGDDGVPDAETTDLGGLATRETRRLNGLGADPAGTSGSLVELVELATAGARIDQLSGPGRPYLALPFTPTRDGRVFEALRERAAAMQPSPAILLACVGPVARHNAAATWARSFFGSGGIAAVQSDPLDGAESASVAAGEHPAPLAVICADPEEDAALLGAIAGALREAGVRRVYLAEASPERAERSGADAAVADGIDMVALLTAALELSETRETEPVRG